MQSIMEGAWARMREPRVSYRVYGLNNEFRRPIIHRFKIKGGVKLMDVMAESIVKHNTLLKRLAARR